MLVESEAYKIQLQAFQSESTLLQIYKLKESTLLQICKLKEYIPVHTSRIVK